MPFDKRDPYFPDYEDYADVWDDEAPTLEETPMRSGGGTRRGASEIYLEQLSKYPRRKEPGLWRRIGAIAGGAGAGLLAAGGRPAPSPESVAENILYPGYQRALEDWGRETQVARLGAEAEAAGEQRALRQEEHKARMGAETARTRAWEARARAGPAPRVPSSPSALKTQQLQEQLKSDDPAVREAAQKELDALVARPERETGLKWESWTDETKGTKTLRGFDRTGKQVIEHAFPERRRPPQPSMVPSTLQAREKETQARALAGRAQRLFPNDPEKARTWLSQQAVDDEVYQIALRLIGRPAAKGVEGVAGLAQELGIDLGSTKTDPLKLR